MAITTVKEEGIFVCAYDGDKLLWQQDGKLVDFKENQVLIKRRENDLYVYDESGKVVAFKETVFKTFTA